MSKEMKQGIIDFIKQVNPKLQVKFQDWDIECDIDENTIYVGKTYDKRTDKYFQEFVKTLNPECSNINPFLLSLLHEIGHIETWEEEVEQEKDIIYNLLKMQYDIEDELADEVMEEYCKMYFRIPLEQIATEWGIDYALNHLDLMKEFDWLHN